MSFVIDKILGSTHSYDRSNLINSRLLCSTAK